MRAQTLSGAERRPGNEKLLLLTHIMVNAGLMSVHLWPLLWGFPSKIADELMWDGMNLTCHFVEIGVLFAGFPHGLSGRSQADRPAFLAYRADTHDQSLHRESHNRN